MVKIDFSGKKEKECIQALMDFIVDGGGEDILGQIIQQNVDGVSVTDMKFDMDKKEVTFITE
ncbi:MAG: hypothetical protein ACOCWO_03660 [Candidatus Muiribacteriaceae bacterium]